MALYSNVLSVIRQHLSSAVGDLIEGTFASGTTTTGVHTMLRKANDWYNHHGYKCYIYGGTNIGEEREVSDWVLSTNTLTLAPAFTAAIDNTSKYELHYIFFADELLKAINQTIESIAGKYLVDIKNETTIRLTSTTDNLGNTVYTFEYALPLSLLYLYRVITEEAVAGKKLTGTISGTFTSGETVTGGTSGATGELAYAGSTYIRVRKVSGTFAVGEIATGGSSSATCSTITAVDDETAGGGRFLYSGIIDTRDWSIIKSYPPKLKLHKGYYSVDEDLYLRLEGQGTQPIVTSDTDMIYLPPDWLIAEAILRLPSNKIQSNKLDGVLAQARVDALYYRDRGGNYPNPWARQIVE